MIKNAAVLFKENGGKRHNTMLSYSTSKNIITSAKELSKIRSSKQIDITAFMENKNDKIRNIDEKLDVHQSEISRNGQIIDELTLNFNALREHLDKEKENVVNEERKNKLLRDEIDRTNKILRLKNTKLQELSKKNTELDKENETLRTQVAKIEDYTKTISTLRSKAAAGEQALSDLRGVLGEREKEAMRLRERVGQLQGLRVREEQRSGELVAKDVLISNLRQALNELQVEGSKQMAEKTQLEAKVERLSAEVGNLKESSAALREKLQESDKKAGQLRSRLDNVEVQNKESLSRMRGRDKQEAVLKAEITALKAKNAELAVQLEEKGRQIGARDAKLEKLGVKVRELQGTLGENYKEKEKLRISQEKIQALKKRLEGLQQLYYGIIPQIQCPFGHELNNPVTIIPCGHNYCLGCKKGYHKECMQCSGKLKIQAVYRNELMDDIIGIVGGVKQIIDILK